MSEATERLLEVWTWLAEDAAAAALGICNSFHGPAIESERSAAAARTLGPQDPGESEDATDPASGTVSPTREPAPSFTISVGGACPPAHAGPGVVHVGMQPQPALVFLEKVFVQRIEPGQTKMIVRPNPAQAPQALGPGLDEVDVAIHPTHESVGVYWSRVRDATGVVDSPFLIYLDGLPP